MTYRTVFSLIVALCIFPTTLIAAPLEYSGQIGLGGQVLSESGDSAKGQEYQDKDSAVIGFVNVNAFKGSYYLHFDLGKKTELSGGRFNDFKASIYYNDLRHNISQDARTHCLGLDSNQLVDSGNQADPSEWTRFNYYVEHETYGIDTEWSFNTPFYVEIGAEQRESDGRLPYGSYSSGPSAMIELPAPVDWTTDTGFLGAGYRTDKLVMSLRADVSEFDNDDEVLFWDADVTDGISNQGLSLAPDSDYYKVAGQMVWRPDIWASSLALRASYSQHDNSLDLFKIEAGAGKFDGEVNNTSFDAAFNFSPVDSLDAKVFLNYFERENNGDTVSAVDDPTITNSLNEYDSTSVGFDLGYALTKNTSIDGGFEYTDTSLDGRSDADGYEDTRLYLQWRNRSFKSLELRAKVGYLDRDGDPNKENSGVADGERAYDVADQERASAELAAMFMASDKIDLGIELGWWDAEYDDTDFNLTDLEHFEAFVTVGYYEPEMFTSSLYFGYEYDETDMTSDSGDGYKEEKEFDTFAYGINVEVPLFDVLVVSVLWDHSWVDGEADFNRADLVDFNDVDDYTIKTLELKCDYDFSETIDFTVGYIYEKYEFDDDQWDGYAYLPGDSTLSGAYSDQDFENNIGYFLAKYRF